MAVRRLCLDTSAYSHFQRGHSETVELIDQADWIGVPSIVIGELWMGFSIGKHLKKNEELLYTFLSNILVETIDIDRKVSQLYGQLAAGLRARGTPIPTNDIWIAACALNSGSTILTFDAHFRLVPQAGKVVLS